MSIIIKSCNFSKKSFFKIWANFVPSCFLHIDGITSNLYVKFQKIWRTTDFGMKFSPKIYEYQILRKIIHQSRNQQHITMCPCIKFQSIWRTLHSQGIYNISVKKYIPRSWRTLCLDF